MASDPSRPVLDTSAYADDAEDVYQDPCSSFVGLLAKYNDTWFVKYAMQNRGMLERHLNFTIRPTDILVVSFPKSGTTWMQNIVLKLAEYTPHKTSEDTRNLEDKFPMIEYNHSGSATLYDKEGVRFLKSHMPYNLQPNDFRAGNGKLIYIARNPKDTAVSMYHYIKGLAAYRYTGEFNNVMEDFIAGKVMYGPWGKHVESYWTNRDKDNVLFLTFEQTKKDPLGTVRQVAQFLGWSVTEDQLKEVVEVTSFDSMKKDDQANYKWWRNKGIQNSDFLRKGVVGDWKNFLTDELNERVEKELLDPLRQIGLNFDC